MVVDSTLVATAPAGVPATRRSVADLPRWVGAAAGAVAVLLVWWLLSVTVFARSGAVPTPIAVVRQLWTDGWALYGPNVGVTTWSAVQGFLWGNLAAVAVATVALLVPVLEGLATQVAVLSYCIPLTAIGPIVLIVSDAGSRATSVFLAAISVFFTTVVACLLGWRAADRAALDLVRAYGGGRWAQLRKVQLVAALPNILAGLKIAAPAAFLGAVLGEYFGGVDSGMGVVITAAQTNLRVAQIWALALISGAVAGAGYALVGLLARLVAPWSTGADDPGRGRP
ncbi:ABC transporter permease [Nakamurella endophytica]|uniref:ABC transporter permease n=1 Tax=Nakamurella endophytica TaxID=1748367 RepID=A0A917TBT2_9ACTN|nr:ABC transporter permease subunit [Nakamurella endophytica]GGM16563.1 ABC transporter permease [Nakamurella endophytica]